MKTMTKLDILSLAILTCLFLFLASLSVFAQYSASLIAVENNNAWAASSFLQASLLLMLLIPLAIWWPIPRYRAIFQGWAIGALYVLLLAPTHYFNPVQVQIATTSQLILTLLLTFALTAWLMVRRPHLSLAPHALLPALTIAIILSYGWLAWGAFGSPLDILLNLFLGLTIGLLTGITFSSHWLHETQTRPQGAGWDIFTGGVAATGLLMLIASGSGFNGTNLLLMLILPTMGWLVILVSYIGQPETPANNWPGLSLLIGLTIAFPLMLTDTDGLSMLLLFEGGEIIGWAFTAAFLSMMMAIALTVLMLILHVWLKTWLAWWPLPAVTSVLAILIGAIIYSLFGQPGFYGDKLFVILKNQADVSAATEISNYDERRRYVYQTLVSHANQEQAELRADLESLGVAYTPYYLVNAIAVEGGLLHQTWLESRPEVDRVIPSTVMRPLPSALPVSTGPISQTTGLPEWNLTQIGADQVWEEFGIRGEGIVIGQSDSGVQWDHPELQATYRGQADDHDYHWFDPWNHSRTPSDRGGHGTHTLGSIVGQTVGVAPEATWFACANLDRTWGSPALYLDCLQFMLAPFPLNGDPFTQGDPTQSAHVLNNSWGCPPAEEGCDTNSLRSAVEALRSAGIFVVVSAGNDGPACSSLAHPLSIYEAVFSVGAVDEAQNIASFSSLGPVLVDDSGRLKPDIAAPGVDILSAYPNNSYDVASGTSMAGPHVVGAVALMWSANPNLIGDIDRTSHILRETATPSNQALDLLCGETTIRQQPNNLIGYGLLNAYEAVRQAMNEE